MRVKVFPIVVLLILILMGVFLAKPIYITCAKKIYKTDYADIVHQYAEKYELEPNFIFAVIKVESDFKPDAVSNVGARGLMQIMPDTYNWIESKLKEKDTTYDDMFDPEINIWFGSYLYGVLMREFGSHETAIAAYHAGRGAVGKWLDDAAYSQDGKTLKQTPVSATNHYIQKVMNTFERYNKLYLS